MLLFKAVKLLRGISKTVSRNIKSSMAGFPLPRPINILIKIIIVAVKVGTDK